MSSVARAQPDEVAVPGVAGQPVLVVVAGDDRVGPSRTGLRGQRLLTGVDPIPARLPLRVIVHRRIQRRRLAHGCQVRTPQPTHMIGNQTEHPLVPGGGLQPGGDRHPRWSRHRLHPTPLPQLHRRHKPDHPNTYDKLGSSATDQQNRQLFSPGSPAMHESRLMTRRLLRSNFGNPVLLPDEIASRLPETLAAASIAGGAVYDAMVGLSAREAGIVLVTRDRRASETYANLGVAYELVG